MHDVGLAIQQAELSNPNRRRKRKRGIALTNGGVWQQVGGVRQSNWGEEEPGGSDIYMGLPLTAQVIKVRRRWGRVVVLKGRMRFQKMLTVQI